MPELTAKDIMTTDVKTVTEETTLKEIAELLAQNRISGMPVVDKHGALVGIVTEADLIDENKRRAAIPRTAVFGVWVVPETLLENAYEEGFSLKAGDVMTRHVVAATEDTPVDELADLMLRKRINRIPIVRGDRVVGIVTRMDVLRGLRAASQ